MAWFFFLLCVNALGQVYISGLKMMLYFGCALRLRFFLCVSNVSAFSLIVNRLKEGSFFP